MARYPSFPSLAALGERFLLTDGQVGLLAWFGGILADDEHAPTTVRDPRLIRDDHVADALVALDLLEVRQARVLADLGAGAGVPGIPLAIALPDTQVILVEGNGRKCAFMQAVVEQLSLTNAEVVHGRAETWGAGLGRMDVVTARALAPLDVVAEYAAPLLREGGALVAWRGQRDMEDEAAAGRAAQILGLDVAEPLHVQPYAGAMNRHLHVMTKTRPTPTRFPRRDGVARKRPLGRV